MENYFFKEITMHDYLKAYIMISKLRDPMFWQSKLPKIIRDAAPIVFSRPQLASNKPGRRMEVAGLMGSRLTRSISQVSNLSKPTRSQLKRSFSIVSNYSVLSRNSRNSRSRSNSQKRAGATLSPPGVNHRRFGFDP